MSAATIITHDQARAIAGILDGIVDAVRAAGPLGCPAGVLYAALMVHGCTLDKFETIMGALVTAGRLTKKLDCYFTT